MTVIWCHEKCQLIILIMLTFTFITFIIYHPNISNMTTCTNGCQQRLLRHVHVVVVDVKPIHVVDGVNLMTCCLNSQIQTAHHVCTLGWLWLQRSAQVEPVLGQIDQKVASFAPCKGNFHLRRHIGQNHPAATHVNHRAKLGESFDAHQNRHLLRINGVHAEVDQLITKSLRDGDVA